MFTKDFFLYKYHHHTYKRRLKYKVAFFVLLILFLSSLLIHFSFANVQPTPPNENSQPFHILFISSYNSAFPTYYQQIDGLRESFPQPHYLIDIEFMDSKRFNTEDNLYLFNQLLTYKLDHYQTYDLIITADDNALSYVSSNHEKYFKNIPVIFLGVNQINYALSFNDDPFITGVVEASSIDQTIEEALTLYPKATDIYAIVDNTLGGMGDHEKYTAFSEQFPQLTFHTLDLKEMSFQDLENALHNMSTHDIVLLLAAYEDKDHVTLSFEESVKRIVNKSVVPIFHLYEHGIGDGLIGGVVISHHEQATAAAAMAHRYLDEGISLSDIPVLSNSPNLPMYDYQVLKNYNLNPKVLPDQTFFINKPQSILDIYFKEVLISLFVLVILIILIIYLSIYIRKAKHIEEHLNVRTHELEDLYEELAISEEELRSQNVELMKTQKTLEIQKNELIKKQKQIEDYAYFDYLTKLPNRLSLKMDLSRHLSDYSPEFVNGALFFIDLDNFKAINDNFGHSVGDNILIEVAKRLREQLSDYGKIYRFGGDEFVVLIDNSCDLETIKYIANQLFERFKEHINIYDDSFYVTFSMGIALIPIHGSNYDELIGSADMAMYSAKKESKNAFQYFDEKFIEQSNNYKALKQNLSHAFDQKEITLYYQSVYDRDKRHIVFLEAMLRWFSPLGTISPEKFIPIAKEMGMMQELNHFVMDHICELSTTLATTQSPVMLSINLSSYELLNVLFSLDIDRIFKEEKVDPNQICFEISESSIERDFDLVKAQVDKLRQLGCKMIIDDFGSRYLSLNYLKKLPVDFVKIDVNLFSEPSMGETILKSLIEVLQEMNIQIIIKNIESSSQLSHIRDYHYDYVQGHYFSFPVNKARALQVILEEDIKIYEKQGSKK